MARDTRQRIVAAARDLVHAASLAEVSTEAVCQAAGVHKGSLYHFFPSKEALGAAVLDCNWALMREMLDEAFGDDVAPLARMDRFVDMFVHRLAAMRELTGATPGCPLGGLVVELAGHGDESPTRTERVLHAWERYFADAISEAKGQGELGAAVDSTSAARRLLAHLQGLALLAKAYDDPRLILDAKRDFRLLLGAAD
ncbi:TetR/AcrR family transcriptional regulator [Solwaraspora sp. WMMD1047]|uniref:TetR/AcrR family transcriptional regulator n=1 Tax=Solwaraspora sp. WMMD1047 TaxID=3016102 RepID=UPI002416C012|nr:TetR/AcrR family transcriptional regulator [Solwaraspora sp. WMMD1047]MDG4834277.1 TetR/AcrR family transcriptional regulator [Solwaraspora sp. WMMD1047]